MVEYERRTVLPAAAAASVTSRTANQAQMPSTASWTASSHMTQFDTGMPTRRASTITGLPSLSFTWIRRPSPGSAFEGWGDACSGKKSCSFVMDRPRSLSATFAEKPVAVDPAGVRSVLESAKKIKEKKIETIENENYTESYYNLYNELVG